MKLKKIVFCGIVAALYAALTIILAPISYGAMQVRVSEALCVLCFFNPVAVWGITIGCLIANIFSTVSMLDIVMGTAASLIGCLLSSRLKNKWLFPLPIIAANAVIVGLELGIVFTPENILLGSVINGAWVGLGEIIALYVVGIPLILALDHTKAGEMLRSI